jgi:hypothetical protein
MSESIVFRHDYLRIIKRNPVVFGIGGRRKTICTEFNFGSYGLSMGACGSVVVKALCYKPEGREFDTG